MPTQEQYDTTKSRYRDIDVKIYLLNYNFQKVDEISGFVLTKNFTNNSTSDIRRTCSITLVPNNSSFDIKRDGKIWLDKYIQIYIGLKKRRSEEYEWNNMGIYLINNPSKVYSGVDNTLTIEGFDLMSKMTGLRNGNLEGMDYIIPQNSNVRKSIIAILIESGFKQYVVAEIEQTVPNEIKISSGGTVYDILLALKNINPNYQMYFDVDGVFHYNEIPNGKDEQITIDDDLWNGNNGVLLNYSISTDFTSIKNVIEVFGKMHDINIKNFGTATVSGNNYNVTIPTVTSLRNNLKIGFIAPSKITNPKLNINGYGIKDMKNENGTIPILSNDVDKYYVVKYIKDKDYFLFMGELQPHAIVKELNQDSPFYVNGTIGEIRIVLQGGEYDNIYTDDLAFERAKWELYTHCRLLDSVTITCVPIYWADVNQVIEITLPNKKGMEEKNKYIIKDISTSDTQTINMMRYYSFYDN